MNDTGETSREGSYFGPYRLTRLLGRGGMGEVYVAEDTVRDRIVALKLMSAAYSQDPVYRKRMQREARIAGRLQEPHVVPIHDFGEIDGQLYVDMRLIDGIDLDSLLQREGPLHPARAVAILRQIASALDAAHAAGVMHRDVKPANILITADDFAYLVDFGIASAATDEKLTRTGTALGSYAYMAPERFTGDPVTHSADTYALACVLHECLTGYRPFRSQSIEGLITAHLMQPVPRPSEIRRGIPRAFDDVIARGMAKKAQHRYPTAGDLARAADDAATVPVPRPRQQHRGARPSPLRADPPLQRTDPIAPIPTPVRPPPASNVRDSVISALLALLSFVPYHLSFLNEQYGGAMVRLATDTLPFELYLVVVVAIWGRSKARRVAAAALAFAGVVVERSMSLPYYGPDALAQPLWRYVIACGTLVLFVAAWGVARRRHPLWLAGLLAALAVVAFVVVMAPDYLSPSNAGWPWCVCSGPRAVSWAQDIAIFVGCCVVCWALDVIGRAHRGTPVR